MLANDRRIGVGQRRRIVVGAVGNAEPAAEIDMLDRVTVGAQLADQLDQQREGVVERLQLGDLAADMHVDAGDADAGQGCRPGVDVAGALPRDAELVLGLAGRDLAMRPGVDIGVDAQRDRRDDTGCDGAGRQQFQLGLGFDVEAVDARGEREIHLARRLADAGKHDPGRRDAGCQRAPQLAFGHHVGAGAELAEQLDDGLVGIGLHGVADERVEAGERLAEDVEVACQRRRRIAVERRADRAGDLRQRHVFGAEHAVAIVEMVHVDWSRLDRHLIRRSRMKGLSSTGFSGSGGSGSLAFSASLRAWTAAS